MKCKDCKPGEARCHLCGRKFKHKYWQWPAMCWCSKCRRLHIYKVYGHEQRIIERFTQENVYIKEA